MDRSLVTRYWDILQGTFLFRTMDKEALRRALLDDACVLESYASGTAIYTRDNFRASLGIIVKGRATVTKTTSGRRIALSVLGPGHLFGAVTLFGQHDYFATDIMASGTCRVVFLPRDLIYHLMQQDFALCENYLAYLTQRIYFLNRKIDAFTGGSAVERLAMYLLGSAEDGTVILPQLTDLADMLNISRASLYRALDALEKAGGIGRNRNKITILDATILQNL